MCKWCDKDEIKRYKHYTQKNEEYGFDEGYDYLDDDCRNRNNCIVYDESDNSYNLWVECEDWYYSGIQFYNIEFCPYCGRKLK